MRANVRVYELLADKEFIEAYRLKTVKGFIVVMNSVNILIEEA